MHKIVKRIKHCQEGDKANHNGYGNVNTTN